MKCSFVKTLYLLITLFVVGCKVETPEGVLPPEKMENVIYDYHLVQAITTEYMPLNYEKKMHINYVFEKHGITKEQFDSSLVWYTRYPRRMHRIYASLEKRTMEELKVLNNIDDEAVELLASNEKMLADTVDLWGGSRVKLLSSSPLNNRVVFHYDADTTYVVGDSILFSFSSKHLRAKADSLRHTAHAALVVEYDDASYASRGVSLKADSAYSLTLERNFNAGIKSMYGFVYYSDNDTLCASKLLLGEISVKRIHPAKE